MTLITATSIAIKASTIPTYKNIWFTAETFINVKAIIKAEDTCRLGNPSSGVMIEEASSGI